MELPLTLEDWHTYGQQIPTLVNLQPSGQFLMEDFYYAGGLPAVLKRLGDADLLYKDCLTANGKTLWENNQQAPCYNDEVIRTLDNPLCSNGGICILRGNLAPRGAVLKPSAASPHLMKHRGRAVVFESFDHYKERIMDEALDVDANSVLVLKNCGPGITDMVRISDARMSGTAFGTVVLHIAPEAQEFGPLASVQDGDWIALDTDAGLLELEVSDAEISARLDVLRQQKIHKKTGGYLQLYIEHVMQADEGCDFDFLVGCRGADVPGHSH
jgi:dihydroxyacid dehydratase/phosphogluconate dehydratase